jgi:CheY-like chemotaxis protein
MPHVLVIDDDAQIRRVFVRMLSREFIVDCAIDAEGALAAVDGVRLFDVMLCDLHLPFMSGQDFYDQLKLRSAHLVERLVIITGSEPAPDDAFAMMLGDRYIVKTGPLADLLTVMRRVAFPRLSTPCAPLAAA